jgi:beta-lactam-binding protein with PASTA domain
MTDFKALFKKDSVGDLLAHMGVTVGILFFLCLIYFYAYLPHVTNHNELIVVPDLKGIKVEELEKVLSEHNLRYEVNDSSYSETLSPLSVLKQFPKPGSKVKENRVIYVSLNRKNPPTLPVPELVDRSLVNAEVVLKSNELKRGKIFYQASQYQNLVLDMRYNGKSIAPNTRIPKGSVIDLVIGRVESDIEVDANL